MEILSIWKILLFSAKQNNNEVLFQKALKSAVYDYGENSLEAGVVLLDIADFYTSSQRELQALEAENRACRILRDFVTKHPELLERRTMVTD